jgi:hypothetical protein
VRNHIETLITQGRDAAQGTVRAWTESVEALSRVPGSAADPLALVDQVFDLAEQVLATQREMAKAWLQVALSLTGAGALAAGQSDDTRVRLV